MYAYVKITNNINTFKFFLNFKYIKCYAYIYIYIYMYIYIYIYIIISYSTGTRISRKYDGINITTSTYLKSNSMF